MGTEVLDLIVESIEANHEITNSEELAGTVLRYAAIAEQGRYDKESQRIAAEHQQLEEARTVKFGIKSNGPKYKAQLAALTEARKVNEQYHAMLSRSFSPEKLASVVELTNHFLADKVGFYQEIERRKKNVTGEVNPPLSELHNQNQ